MKPSLWKQYFEEKGFTIIESEKGFIKAMCHKHLCLIDDWYVAPEYRKSSVAAMRMVFKVMDIAKQKGCTHLAGEVYRSDPMFDYIVNMHQKFGMVITAEDEYHVVTSKSLVEDK